LGAFRRSFQPFRPSKHSVLHPFEACRPEQDDFGERARP
jgi:hypothetical protein